MVRFQSCSVNLFYFFFEGTGESAFRCGAELGMSRGLLSETYEVTGHVGACLPVLELEQYVWNKLLLILWALLSDKPKTPLLTRRNLFTFELIL